ncbi:MAG: hypothetical protein ACRCR5_08130 [Lactococcus garvieae]
MNSKILKRVFIVGVSAQIVFIALVLFSDNFRVALSNLLKSNTMIAAVFYLALFVLRSMDILLLIIAPFASFLLSKNKKSHLNS